MSNYGRNNIGTGCGAIIVFICIGIITIILIVKGLSAVGGSNVFNCKHSKTRGSEKTYWGESGIDPVLRTSSGAIFKDPNFPNYYFDIRTTCDMCNGTGKTMVLNKSDKSKKGVGENIGSIDKCPNCCGTGYEKRPMSQIPKGKVKYEK